MPATPRRPGNTARKPRGSGTPRKRPSRPKPQGIEAVEPDADDGIASASAAPKRRRAQSRPAAPKRPRKKRAARHRSGRLAFLTDWLRPENRRLWLRIFLALPGTLQALILVAALLLGWLLVNTAYHVARKPTELFFPVSGTLNRLPRETWRDYAPLFRAHSTAAMQPAFLAALAQIEAAGNPVARTYWRFRLSMHPLEIWQPASSAVGMYQLIDGTFEEARRYCIHDHVVVEDGPWKDIHSCWFNGLYTRVIPSHAVEMTSAYLDRRVAQTLARHGLSRATVAQKQQLATLIHLCGAGAGEAFARRGLQLLPGQKCGDHDARDYLFRVERMTRLFERLATGVRS